MILQIRRLLRNHTPRNLFSTESTTVSETPTPSTNQQPPTTNTSNPTFSYADVQRLATNEFDSIKFQSLWKQYDTIISPRFSVHLPLPQNQANKLDIIEEYQDSLTPKELRYLRYSLATQVMQKATSNLFPDEKKEYYYDLAFFGKSRRQSLQSLMLAGKEEVIKVKKDK